jgi:hypothetical protein
MSAISTVAVKRSWVANGLRYFEADITGTASYATGGDSLSPELFGVKNIHEAYVVAHKATFDHKDVISDYGNEGAALVVDLTATNAPLVLRYVNGSQVAASTNWSTVVTRVVVAGR